MAKRIRFSLKLLLLLTALATVFAAWRGQIAASRSAEYRLTREKLELQLEGRRHERNWLLENKNPARRELADIGFVDGQIEKLEKAIADIPE